MSSTKPTVVKVQTLTKSQYILAKHIPNANPLKKLIPENLNEAPPNQPTSKPIARSLSSRYLNP